ncbi:hypothetical protein Tco_1019371 [Tanacetum coccineum]|uniref:Uncharacterized protein n=1 Tax=Tanacetum coccineum TaxID=301880 RepID=A0ABQ5FWY2_9ASTR
MESVYSISNCIVACRIANECATKLMVKKINLGLIYTKLKVNTVMWDNKEKSDDTPRNNQNQHQQDTKHGRAYAARNGDRRPSAGPALCSNVKLSQ